MRTLGEGKENFIPGYWSWLYIYIEKDDVSSCREPLDGNGVHSISMVDAKQGIYGYRLVAGHNAQ